MKKIFLTLWILLSVVWCSFWVQNTYAIDFSDAPGNAEKIIEKQSIKTNTSGDFTSNVNGIGKNILSTLKLILWALLVMYIVYAGTQMILAMGDNDEKLSSSKKQLWYALIGLLFINIPWTLYQSFSDKSAQPTQNIGVWSFVEPTQDGGGNIFINMLSFGYTLEDNIIGFLKVLIFFLAIFIIIFEGIKIIAARGNDEDLGKSKSKIFYAILWLIFVGVMEAWKQFAFTGSIDQGKDIFQSLANMALYFAGPIAIFFLSLAGYYFITAAGDEEKIKKAKSIVINTVLATLILLWMYTFLLDLGTLSFK